MFAAVVAALVLGTTVFTASAQEPLWQDLRFVPASGGCDGPFVIEGTGWPDGTVVLQIPGHEGVPPENAVGGYVRFEVPAEVFGEHCEPGATLTVRAERLRPDKSGARIVGEASYQIVGATRETPAAEPEAQFEPSGGDCEPSTVMAGRGYPPNTRLEIAILGMSKELIKEVTTDGSGAFRATLPDSFWQERCRPGQLIGISAIIETDGDRIRADAEYQVASPWRLTLETCDEESMTLRGTAFPPGEPVTLMLADDHWFAHNFAVLDELEADATGGFVTTVPMRCPAEGMTVVGRLDRGWARLDRTVRPAAVGTGGTGAPAPALLPLTLTAAALALLTVARGLSAHRIHRGHP